MSYTITTIAGVPTNNPQYAGDGDLAIDASLNYPNGVVMDAAGNTYIADADNNCIRQIDLNGIITTIAGQPLQSPGYSGDGGPSTNALLNLPMGIAIDTIGNIYIADANNNCIRQIDLNRNITTIAGLGPNDGGYIGDGGPATSAELSGPRGVAVDTNGNIYIADTLNNAIRQVDSSGIISTMVLNVSINGPFGIAVDTTGNVYIADTGNSCIREKNISNNTVTIIAGNGDGSLGYSGDGGNATSALLNRPFGVAVDINGNVYISDTNNNCVRRINTQGIITTIAGMGPNNGGYNGDNILATNAELKYPNGIEIDPLGNIYIADAGNNIIRKLTLSDPPPIICFMKGTQILSEKGYIPVENLKVGDQLITSGKIIKNNKLERSQASNLVFPYKQIQWIGSFTVDQPNINSYPICLKRGSIDKKANMPSSDLYVSPEHSICVNNRMIPAKYLVNGKTIFQDTSLKNKSIEYYHIEMPYHCAIISNGISSESYIDSGNRGMFNDASTKQHRKQIVNRKLY